MQPMLQIYALRYTSLKFGLAFPNVETITPLSLVHSEKWQVTVSVSTEALISLPSM